MERVTTCGEIISRPAFDYEALDPDARTVVRDRTAEIHGLVRITAQSVVKIGRKLVEVKPLLKSHFVIWLKAEFSWSESAAYNFIRVFERFGDGQSVSNFAPSALYLLSAPSAPEGARKEAVKLAAAGEKVTHGKAKRLITHYVGRSGESDREIRERGFTAALDREPGTRESPQLFYVNRLVVAIRNGDLDLKEDRLTYALHGLANLIKERVPLHPPK